MNTLERRVSESLRAYGEGLVMTAQDVDRLEQGLEQKQQVARTDRRRRVWEVAVAACAVTGVVLGGLALRSDPAPPNVPAGSPASATTGLAGIWSFDSWLWTFTADGKLMQSQQPYDPLEHSGSTADPITYTPTAEGFIEHMGTAAEPCDHTWTATISPDGRLRATDTKESGSGCGAGSEADLTAPPEVWEFTRVSPVSVAGANLELLWPTTRPFAVNVLDNVVGTWLFPATGTVLAITASGDYTLRTFDTLYAPEKGTVSVPGAGSLVFTPRINPTCTAVLTSVTSRNSALVAAAADGSCSRLSGATPTWIRIN
jgi:hypothetical protein